MTEIQMLVAIDHAAAAVNAVSIDAVLLYGPTIADQRDRAACERCGTHIGHTTCYVFGIGGGVAHICPPCTLEMVENGVSALDRAV